jgi:hypothetical protein
MNKPPTAGTSGTSSAGPETETDPPGLRRRPLGRPIRRHRYRDSMGPSPPAAPRRHIPTEDGRTAVPSDARLPRKEVPYLSAFVLVRSGIRCPYGCLRQDPNLGHRFTNACVMPCLSLSPTSVAARR